MVVPADVEINLQPVDGDALLLAARTAHDGKDWRTAARLWQQVILLRPDMETAWVSSVLSLREQQRFLEAETVLATALERFPRNKQLLAAHGWNAADLRNRDAAEQRFRVFRELYPDDTGGLIGLHNILLAKGKLAELEMIVSAAAARLPDNREVGLLHASVAGRSGKWAEAAERYQALRPKNPHERAIYISLAEALRHLDRYDEAEQILAEGARRMPDSPQIAIAHAGLPGHERKWEESLRRFDDVLKRFPDEPDAYLGMSLVLKNAGLKTLRACFLHDAAARFPEHVNIQADQYWLWMNPHGWQRARARLEHLTQTHPNVGRYISDFGFALLSSGDPEKAERVLLDGLVRFPGDLSMRMNLARAAAARSAWREAAALWEELNQIRPDNKQIQTELGLARYNLSLLEQESEAAGLPAPAAINASEPVKLVTRFESLGEDCEFGLFQREVGAEPLGLLRFAGTPPEHLISALECRLEGVGTKEHTVLLERGNEYVASDTRFGMTMHTHINPATAEFNATYEMILKKLNYLKRQFLEDLEDGEKIFVYKDKWDRMVPRLRQFRRALSMYGPCKVLIVRLASGGWASGDIEVVDDLTIFGYIDRHGHDGVRWNVPVEGWLSLCRKAAEHWQISGTLMLSPARSETAEARLVCRFESLGEDCEFGLFQRAVGAEPLGLLRFANTTPRDLAAALSCRFDGVGQPENFELIKSVDGTEYIARDKRFGMFMHTHIIPANVQYEPTYETVLKKVQYLKMELVDDLEESNKIFVYRDVSGQTESYLPQITKALALYGQPKLFIVKLAEPGKPNGFIEVRDVNVIVGYIDRKGRTNDGGFNIPIQSWLQLCRNACEIWPAD